MAKPSLTARWKNLFMVNYEVDAALLAPLVPKHCELDTFEGKHLVSLVAFQFLQTRVKGFRIPWHVNFPEINLRLYLKRTIQGETRRGVAFIKEIVPKRAITFVANTLFNEHYITRRMTQRVAVSDQIKAEYTFEEKGQTQRLTCFAAVRPHDIKPGSIEDFITEHYYGYNGGAGRKTLEYQVEHPSWRTYPIQAYTLDVDFAATYGETWGFLKDQKPHSVLLAEGSEVKVYGATKVEGDG
ncbi:MAG: DUF2071 domain-containing protein [Spirochaetes bacterium]|nr:DUF2071 domain-containing protein [Spirochaetota bacterium]